MPTLQQYMAQLEGPGCDAAAVTLSGDTSYTPPKVPDQIIVGGTGNLKVDTLGGSTGVVLPVTAGMIVRLAVTKIYSTANGTTATNLIALFHTPLA